MTLSKLTQQEIEDRVTAGIAKAFNDFKIVSPIAIAEMNQQIQYTTEIAERNREFIDGNGKEGAKVLIPIMQKSIQNLEVTFDQFKRDTKHDLDIVKSDVREILNRIRGGKENNSAADKTLSWVVQKVLPGLVQTFITTIISIIVILTVIHWQEISP